MHDQQQDPFAIIRSSHKTIVLLEAELRRPQAIAPRLTEVARLSRRSRRRTVTELAQFPGYIFVRRSALPMLDDPRWRGAWSPLRLSGSRELALLPPAALDHALWLEAHSAASPAAPRMVRGWRVGERVRMVLGPLVRDGVSAAGAVAAVRGPRVMVRLDGMAFPVSCLAAHLEVA